MIRTVLVGCGRVSHKHFESFRENDDIELIGVCDTDPATLMAATTENAVPGFADMAQMLEALRPDLVVLATPSGLHPEQAILAAQAGAHVVTEKPMAIRWSDGIRMVEACEQAGVRLFEVKQHRFNPAIEAVKAAVEDGAFGRIYDAHVSVFWTRPQSYYDLAEWRGTWEQDGGALMNQAIHYVDLLRWLVGPVESVFAFTATLARRIEVEDTATMSMKFRSGALGTVNVTMLTHSENLEGSVTILGEHGTVRLGGVACNQIEHWSLASDAPDPKQPDDCVYGLGHPRFYNDVVHALNTGDRGRIEGAEGLKSLEIVVGAYLSSQEGRKVALPLNP